MLKLMICNIINYQSIPMPIRDFKRYYKLNLLSIHKVYEGIQIEFLLALLASFPLRWCNIWINMKCLLNLRQVEINC